MTLKTDIAADATTVFLNTDEFATSWTHYPNGRMDEGVAVTLVSFGDGLEGRGQVPGDGSVLHTDHSLSERSSMVLEVPSTVTVTGEGEGKPDMWEDPDGRIWVTKRVAGVDPNFQSVAVVSRKGRHTYRGQKEG